MSEPQQRNLQRMIDMNKAAHEDREASPAAWADDIVDTLAVLCDKPHKSFKSSYVFKKKNKRRPGTVSGEATRMRSVLKERRRRAMQHLTARMHESHAPEHDSDA